MTTVIYRRQSLDKTGEGLGIERQLKECQKVARARGWKVSDVLTDNSVSASKGGRPAYTQLIDMMKSGAVETVIILRIDRLLRLNDELEQLIQIVEQYPVRVVTAEGDVDLSTPQGRLIARVLVSVARNEIEVKSARQKLANQQKAAAGRPHGSRRPYGYEDDLVTIRECEADILREMARRVIQGHSYAEIAWWLNEAGKTTTLGKPWYPVTIRNLLMKPRYGGIREYRGEHFQAAWEPVFNPEQWERLQLAMSVRRQHGQARPIARKYLLTGLVYCSRCGMGLNGAMKQDRPTSPKRRIYYCRTVGDTTRERGCGGVTRNADALEDFVLRAVLYRLNTPELAKLLEEGVDTAELNEKLSKRREIQQRLDSLVDDYAVGVLSKPQLVRAKGAAETELARLEGEIERLNRARAGVQLPVDQTLAQAWELSESNSWRRGVLSLLIKRIVLTPGTTKPFYTLQNGRLARFDPSLVTIDWLV